VEWFTAAISGLFSTTLLQSAEKLSFVSEYRFSDTASRLKADAPLGAGRRNSIFFSNLFSRCGDTQRDIAVLFYAFGF
jgi:hypothetical protein